MVRLLLSCKEYHMYVLSHDKIYVVTWKEFFHCWWSIGHYMCQHRPRSASWHHEVEQRTATSWSYLTPTTSGTPGSPPISPPDLQCVLCSVRCYTVSFIVL